MVDLLVAAKQQQAGLARQTDNNPWREGCNYWVLSWVYEYLLIKFKPHLQFLCVLNQKFPHKAAWACWRLGGS
jgi:hypothetical protein